MARAKATAKSTKRAAKPATKRRRATGEADGNLVLVESPTKARTLTAYLGKGFRVLASKGHVKDLPVKELGVDIERNFKPKYVYVKAKAGALRPIREAAKSAKTVYLASDPDREGEAIAFHLAEVVKRANASAVVRRALFHEITPDAVRRAIEEPTEVDVLKVEAQQARRVLDRLVGYLISPMLWKAVRWGLSAGRVQTVALRLITEREKEVKAFVPVKFWVLTAAFNDTEPPFVAKAKEKLDVESEATAFVERFSKAPFVVSDYSAKTRAASPPPPFKTSTLQQAASNALGYSARRTMTVAQSLYEGVDLPTGRRGLITYMRTDSVRMAEAAVKSMRAVVKELFGADYVADKPRRYADKAGAQGAHEAVRPTDPSLTPERVAEHLTGDQEKLYRLIWHRALATQASAAKVENQRIALHPDGSDRLFVAEGRVVLFDGFYRVRGDVPKDTPLPALAPGERLTPSALEAVEKETEPPPRYTEAALVKALEAHDIGRPSTYASIIGTLLNRSYVETKERKLVPTPMGTLICDLLVENFPDVFDLKFTASMEDGLDLVEEGKRAWVALLEEFYEKLSPELASFEKRIPEIKENLPDIPLYYRKRRFKKRFWKRKK